MSIKQLQDLMAASAEAGAAAPNFSDEPAKARQDFANFLGALPAPEGITSVPTEIGGVPGLLVAPDAGSDAISTLYLHGGGYLAGSAAGYLGIIGNLALSSGAAVFAPDYTLAPDKTFPAAVNEVVAVYRALVDAAPGRPLAVAGDSAGGGLSVALLLSLRSAGLPQPKLAVLLSPWADLTGSGASVTERAHRDPLLDRQQLSDGARVYLGGADATDPLASPALADLSGLAPLQIHVGSEEVLYDDATRLAERSGGSLRVWDGMVHDWALFWFAVDEAAEVLQVAGSSIAEAVQTALVA